MNGVHDMGGMDGFGKVEVEPNEPPFHERWEGRVFAMVRSLGYAGAWHIDHGRFAQEALPPRTYLAASYYWRWALGMQKNLLERGFVGQDEIDAGHALRPGKALRRKLTADVVPTNMTRSSFFRQQQGPARFKPGDRVRTQNIAPARPHPPAPLCARQAGHRRADPRLPRLSRFGRGRSRRRSAVALHGRVRRQRDLGAPTPTRP